MKCANFNTKYFGMIKERQTAYDAQEKVKVSKK